MALTIAAEKAALRKRVKEIRFSAAHKAASDRVLLSRFLALPQVEAAEVLFLYYGTGSEPDTARLLPHLTKVGKVIALPCCLKAGEMEFRRYLGPDRLRQGPFGIPQPDDSCPILSPTADALLLAPALCCDRRGFRLGHGGGYYDRYLARYPLFTLALCRKALLMDRLPAEPHDRPLALILTESESLSFS